MIPYIIYPKFSAFLSLQPPTLLFSILVAYAVLTALSFVLSPRTLHTVNVFLLRLTVSSDPFCPIVPSWLARSVRV
jgi:hypothetical protein